METKEVLNSDVEVYVVNVFILDSNLSNKEKYINDAKESVKHLTEYNMEFIFVPTLDFTSTPIYRLR